MWMICYHFIKIVKLRKKYSEKRGDYNITIFNIVKFLVNIFVNNKFNYI